MIDFGAQLVWLNAVGWASSCDFWKSRHLGEMDLAS